MARLCTRPPLCSLPPRYFCISMRGNTTPPVAAGALSDKRLPISGGNPPPSPWEEISRKRGAIVSVKSLYLNSLSRRISRAEIFAKIERKYPKHILETAE